MKPSLVDYVQKPEIPFEQKVGALLNFGHLLSSQQFVDWGRNTLDEAPKEEKEKCPEKIKILERRIEAREKHARKFFG